jgi:MHS family shikimate/dehydroshikimate transporter-like MFS transporter
LSPGVSSPGARTRRTRLKQSLDSFLVGLLPTYQQIGILAPVLLIALRLLQAMGLGGEWGGAVLRVCESAPPERRGLFGSLVQVGNPISHLTATGVFALATTSCPGAGVSRFCRAPC